MPFAPSRPLTYRATVPQVRAIVRDASRARPLLPDGVEIVEADVRFPDAGVGLARAIQGVESLLVLTGTSAFPSKKWGPNNDNNPKAVDEKGTKNLVTALDAVNAAAAEGGARGVKRVTLLSSIGVQRRSQFPFSILNTFGVLDAKAEGELALIQVAPATDKPTLRSMEGLRCPHGLPHGPEGRGVSD